MHSSCTWILASSFLALASLSAYGAPRGVSDFHSDREPVLVEGVKYPNTLSEGSAPIVTHATALPLVFNDKNQLVNPAPKVGNYTALLPYVLAAPDQDEAGSCLYMSLTGIAEWWLAFMNPSLPRQPDGPLDLSERYLMNIAGVDEDASPEGANWRTDSIYLFNKERRTVLNSAYRFTKGWHTDDGSGGYQLAQPNAPGAVYDVNYNWIDQRATISGGYVALPSFHRDILFADPESDQWNVGVAPADIARKVKQALVERHAPVHVIYNHLGYWHAVVVVGYDDELANNGCVFVQEERAYLRDKSKKFTEDADGLLGDKLERSYQANGGCHGSKGMFYVRDSIYADAAEPVYNYDPSNQGSAGHYSKKIVLHEYDWLLYMANHVTQIGID